MTVDAAVRNRNPYQWAATPSGDAAELWQRYQSKPSDRALRDELILRYAPLVKFLAGRVAMFLPPALSAEDLLGHGTVGLIEAISRYDPRLGVKFESYATRRIWGAMVDTLRSFSMLSRGVSRQVRAMDDAFAQLETDLGRSPTTAEVAERLHVDEGEVLDLLVAANFSLLSLDTPVGGDDNGDGQTLLDTLADEGEDPESHLERREVLANLTAAIEGLSERERLLMSLYYYEELTLKEIARVMGVSESRVSQIHSLALTRLRAALRQTLGRGK